ncbi:hypothetical protein BDZ91DRAFT_121929 [Kalaharituber pfeilii]|nr:hypothetical protein BDZ91DRAFT_121929 [Kalaharituber pfeilii]
MLASSTCSFMSSGSFAVSIPRLHNLLTEGCHKFISSTRKGKLTIALVAVGELIARLKPGQGALEQLIPVPCEVTAATRL